MAATISSRDFFRRISLIYFAQMIMLVVFAGVGYFLIEGGSLGEPNNELAVLLQKIIIVAVPVSMAAAYFVFRFATRNIPPQSTLSQKMNKYFVAVIIRSALLEVPGLLVVVAAIATAQSLLLIIIPVILFVFALLRPTPSAAAQDLELSPEEREQVENPEAAIAEPMG